ncbi:MAG: glycosyltransferase family 2 protein [bacterium]|nr:glycosyltransferase family 2 protein [bacterium]
MYHQKKVSVVFATYKEKDSIRAVIEDFLATGFVDEVIVVNNNAELGTDEEVRKTTAKLIYEKRQGYGYTYQTGIIATTGDYIILCEPDGTFVGSDLERMLVYAKDFQVVFGTRTNQSSILDGAAMGLVRKLADVFEAKVIEVLFATNSLTDVGCTYKLFTREAIEKIKPLWREGSPLFATELILITVSSRIPFIEVPITFRERVGESTLTEKFSQLAAWGLRILWFIILYRIRYKTRNKKTS